MKRIYKFIEVGYLVVAIILGVEAIIHWSSNRQKAYMFLFFSVLAIGMYFFKKYMRRKIQNNDNKN